MIKKILGPNAIKKAQQMIETELMLNKAGWLDGDKHTKLTSNFQEFQLPIYKTG